jgi:A/G-specific adenine glycosylase
MLQQTRVDTVIPYYHRFLKEFPTVQALSNAEPQSVLKSWEGLGYYSRARNLMAAANEVVERYNGKLPSNSKELKNLKGFGPYTSAAVASIAFSEPIACIDGNVKRVISRIFATHENLESVAQDLVAKEDPASFNQAMMELGALICTPKNQKCLICPVAKECKAKIQNRIDEFPARKIKSKPKEIFATSVLIKNKEYFLLTKRESFGRYKDFYEFPTFENDKKQLSESEIKKVMKNSFGVSISNLKRHHGFRHQLTHCTYRVQTFSANTAKTSSKGRWYRPEEIKKLPLSRLQQKVIELF